MSPRNRSGNELIGICESSAGVILNNLRYKSKHFSADLTFKRGLRWLSQLDLAFCDVDSLKDLKRFHVQKQELPSDHRPIEISYDLNLAEFYLNETLNHCSRIENYDHIIETKSQ